MSSTRTQVYLTEAQRERIDTLTQAEGITLAEVVRRALDDYLERQSADVEAALSATFGAVPDAAAPNRDEWERG